MIGCISPPAMLPRLLPGPFFVPFLAAASVLGQRTVVSPARYADREAPSSNAFPFGSTSQNFRYLNVHDDLAGNPRTILGFALRRGATTSTTVTPAMSVTLDGFMSTAVTTGATVDATFDNNHGGDKAQVLTSRTINFPAAGTGLVPYPFLYQVPLDQPFSFGGSGPLCWEVRITARVNASSTFHDYVAGTSSNPTMAVSRYGAGCMASGASAPFALTGGSSVDWPNHAGQVTATTSAGPPRAPAVYLVGASATSYGGLPLPLLLPGTSGGASGPCYLNTDVLLSIAGALSSSGAATFRVDVPLFPFLSGVDLFGQAFAVDGAANSLGLVSSNGVDHHIVAPYTAPPGGRVYASGSLGATGTRGASQTLVVQFTTT